MLAHTGQTGSQWTEYPYQQQQQLGQPPSHPYNPQLPPDQPLSLDPAQSTFAGYPPGQGWNGQQYVQQGQQVAYYAPQGGGGGAPPGGGVVGPSGGGLAFNQRQQMAMMGGQQRMNGYAQQNGMLSYDGGTGPVQLQYPPTAGPSTSSFPAYPPRSQPPPQSSGPPPPHSGAGQSAYGMSYVHSTHPPPSSSPAPAPMVPMSATAQRFQSTPSSSPAPPFQHIAPSPSFQQPGHPPHPQQQGQLPPHPSSSTAPGAAQRVPQQQVAPPPTAAALQTHLARVEEVKSMQQNIRQLELILQRGTYQDGGPRAGQPIAPEHRAAMERQLQDLKTAELGVINECEAFIRAHGGSGNVHHYVERYHMSQAQQAQAQYQRQQHSQQHPQAYNQQFVAAAQQQQQSQGASYGGALPHPPRPNSAVSFQQQQQQMGGGGEMGPPVQGHQRIASYQSQTDFSSPQMAHHLPPHYQQQQKPPQQPQQGMAPHPSYPAQTGPPNQQPQQFAPQQQQRVHSQAQMQPQMHPQASSNSLSGGGPGPPPGMALSPQQQPPHSMPPQQHLPPPHQQPQPQPPHQRVPSHPQSAVPASGPPPGHPLSQPPPTSSLPSLAHNPLPPPPPSASTHPFSPDLPPGLRAQMAAAAREQAQRALVANRTKMTLQQTVRPAVNGEMPVLTMAGFRTKEEWEKMQREFKEKDEKRMAALAATKTGAGGGGPGVGVNGAGGGAGAPQQQGQAQKHPTVVLAEQAANGGGAVPSLGELVAQVPQKAFWEQLKAVLSKRGVSIAPQGYFVEQRSVDLHQLWKLVVGQHGGVLKADQSSAWPAIAAQLNLPSAPASPIPALLKELYHRTLVAFEEQWSGSIVKQREKEQVMQGAKRMLEARGNGGGIVNGNHHARSGGPPQPFPGGLPAQQQQFQLGIAPSTRQSQQQQQNFVPTSGSPASFTLPTPAPNSNTASSPSLAFSLPSAASGTTFSLPAASPSSHAYAPPVTNNGLLAGSPSQSSMFATSMMPFPPTPMSDPATYASLPPGPAPTSSGSYPPLQQSIASARFQQQALPPSTSLDDEPSIRELLAAAAELKAESLAEKGQAAGTSPSGTAAVVASTPQTSSTPREQVASPTALAAAAPGQVAPFSVNAGGPPSVTLSRANSHTAGPVTTPTAACSPGPLAAGTPGSAESLSRGTSILRKRDREKSREMDGAGGSGVTGAAGGGIAGQDVDDDEDEGRKREGSNPFQHSPLSRGSGAGTGGRASPALAMTPAASSVSSAGQPTPDLVASKALRPDTATTTATTSPSPHAFSEAFSGGKPGPPSSTSSSSATASKAQQSVSTPAASAHTPASLQTPAAQLAAGFGGGLTISTPPLPHYSSATVTDPFAALNELSNSPSLGGLGGWDVNAAAGTTSSSLNLDFGTAAADISVDGGGAGGLGDGLDFSAFDFGAGGGVDFGSLPAGFDFPDSSTNGGTGASSAALPSGLQEAGRKPSDDWTGGLLDFEFASDGFNS
ncbi:hypothetical protein JCM11251_000787 [Rhodosporidiobolus azoricus]